MKTTRKPTPKYAANQLQLPLNTFDMLTYEYLGIPYERIVSDGWVMLGHSVSRRAHSEPIQVPAGHYTDYNPWAAQR